MNFSELLSERAESDFLNWYVGKYCFKEQKFADLNIYQKGDVLMGLMQPTIHYAYIIEWFDSVELYIEIEYWRNKRFACCLVDSKLGTISCNKEFENRNEAMKDAIIKANTIYTANYNANFV